MILLVLTVSIISLNFFKSPKNGSNINSLTIIETNLLTELSQLIEQTQVQVLIPVNISLISLFMYRKSDKQNILQNE